MTKNRFAAVFPEAPVPMDSKFASLNPMLQTYMKPMPYLDKKQVVTQKCYDFISTNKDYEDLSCINPYVVTWNSQKPRVRKEVLDFIVENNGYLIWVNVDEILNPIEYNKYRFYVITSHREFFVNAENLSHLLEDCHPSTYVEVRHVDSKYPCAVANYIGLGEWHLRYGPHSCSGDVGTVSMVLHSACEMELGLDAAIVEKWFSYE